MPEIRDEDWALIEAWRQLPGKQRRVFSVSGAPASGKTAFLEAVRDRLPEAVLIDCSGLSADEVFLRMGQTCRARPEGEPVVLLLANAQYAGESVTSTEPARVVYPVAWGFRRFRGRDVWVMVERDPARMPAPEPAGKHATTVERRPEPEPGAFDITLSAEDREATGVEGGTTDPRLVALAAGEQRAVPVEVWRLLCVAVGLDPTEAELLGLAERHDDLVTAHAGDAVTVAFLDDSVRHVLRSRAPWGRDEQARAVGVLLAAARELPVGTWSLLGPIGRYVAHALALHAALADKLPVVLDDGRVLAQCVRSWLYTALAVAYPDGVPYASVAASVRYLEYQGIEPESQAEWVAWLHHSAVTEGRTELAEALLDSGVPLPWRTEWSRLRPMGVFRIPDGPGRVEALGIVKDTSPSGGLSVVTATDTRTDLYSSPRYTYRQQEWDPATGTPRTAPKTVKGELEEAGWPCSSAENPPVDGSAAFARNVDGAWEPAYPSTGPLPPRCPRTVTRTVRLASDPSLWVLSGTTGLFAARVLDADAPEPARPFTPKRREKLHTTAAPWPLPDRAAATLRGDGVRDWLEEAFGAGSCHRFSPDRLPAGLTTPGARRFLTEIGLPEVSDLIHLRILPAAHDATLTEVPWPGTGRSVPRPQRARVEAPTDGPFYVIGGWMFSRLLLDGGTGQLWRDTTGGVREPLAANSLLQFFAMVRLYDTFRRIHFPNQPDHEDALDSLTAWCRRIDTEAATREAWTTVFESVEFQDNTWKFAAHDAGFA